MINRQPTNDSRQIAEPYRLREYPFLRTTVLERSRFDIGTVKLAHRAEPEALIFPKTVMLKDSAMSRSLSAANASGELGRLGAGPPGGTDARRDDGHAPAPARVGACARAGRAGRAVLRGGRGPGRGQGRASGAAHPSPLGHGATELTFRRPAGAGAAPPCPADHRRGSDPAVGRGVSGPGSADRADDASTSSSSTMGSTPRLRRKRDVVGRTVASGTTKQRYECF